MYFKLVIFFNKWIVESDGSWLNIIVFKLLYEHERNVSIHDFVQLRNCKVRNFLKDILGTKGPDMRRIPGSQAIWAI